MPANRAKILSQEETRFLLSENDEGQSSETWSTKVSDWHLQKQARSRIPKPRKPRRGIAGRDYGRRQLVFEMLCDGASYVEAAEFVGYSTKTARRTCLNIVTAALSDPIRGPLNTEKWNRRVLLKIKRWLSEGQPLKPPKKKQHTRSEYRFGSSGGG